MVPAIVKTGEQAFCADFTRAACVKLELTRKYRSLGMSGRNRRFLLRSLYVFLLVCAASIYGPDTGTGETPQPAPANETATPRQSPRLLANSNVKLGIGDLIEISVFGVPDLSTKTRISGSGDVYLPLIDYVHVADLTTDEAQQLIQKRLEDGGFVRGPHVSIFVDESASQADHDGGRGQPPRSLPSDWRAPTFRLDLGGGGIHRAGRAAT